jgi:predicted nucleic acid-binding Zn ribbon protein
MRSEEVTSRKAGTLSLKDCIGNMLESYKIQNKYDETFLISSWESMMGKAIASRTSKIFIKDKTLYVTLTSAPLKNELNLGKTKIVKFLNEQAGKEMITEVAFL